MADDDPEVIREEIHKTQESLASKLSTLEDKVVETVTQTTETVAETVQAVKEKVAETVGSVKESVASTVQTVKRTFDLEYQVQQHPLLMVGGSCAAGFLAGQLLPRRSERASHPRPRTFASTAPSTPNGTRQAAEEGPGLLNRLTEQFHDELQQVKGLALGALFGLARDWVGQNLPGQFGEHIKEVFDNVTTKLGGQRIEEPVVENLSAMWQNRGERSEQTARA
jgi:ElaB/YqjD/DUF883 family membrane-anchored ribosome-binding protein